MSGQLTFSPERLQEEIDRRVLSQSEAARLLGFPERSIQRWLAGVQPRRAAVRRMGEVFEVDPVSFYVEPEAEAA